MFAKFGDRIINVDMVSSFMLYNNTRGIGVAYNGGEKIYAYSSADDYVLGVETLLGALNPIDMHYHG